MKDFKSILYPVALTEISPKVAPYVVTLARQLDAQVHLLHVLHRFEWFVDTYVSDDSSKPDFKRIAATSKARFCPGPGKNSRRLKKVSERHPHRQSICGFRDPLRTDSKLCGIRRDRSHRHGDRDRDSQVDFRFGRGKSLQAGPCARDADKDRLKPIALNVPEEQRRKTWKPNGKSANLIYGKH